MGGPFHKGRNWLSSSITAFQDRVIRIRNFGQDPYDKFKGPHVINNYVGDLAGMKERLKRLDEEIAFWEAEEKALETTGEELERTKTVPVWAVRVTGAKGEAERCNGLYLLNKE